MAPPAAVRRARAARASTAAAARARVAIIGGRGGEALLRPTAPALVAGLVVVSAYSLIYQVPFLTAVDTMLGGTLLTPQ